MSTCTGRIFTTGTVTRTKTSAGRSTNVRSRRAWLLRVLRTHLAHQSGGGRHVFRWARENRGKDIVKFRLFICLLGLVVLVATSASAAGARRETLMKWDDGPSYTDPPFTGSAGERAAVFFQAPPWARSVAGLQVFIWNDGVDASAPGRWTTESFLAYVWRVTPGEPRPSLAVCYGANSGAGYPEDEFLEIRFPEPVSIEDYAVFPDKQFFVGLEWLHDGNPLVGAVSASETHQVSQKSWTYSSGHWGIYLDQDILIRAIVSDAVGTPVEDSSWGVIKALYR